MKIKRKFRGIAILDMAIATVMLMLITGSFATLFGNQFQQLKAGKLALEAQQIAELNASILKTLDYNKVTDATELANGKLHSTQGEGQTSSITGYEDEIVFSGEGTLSDGTKYRIATINVYKNGDTLPRSTVSVPVSSATSVYNRAESYSRIEVDAMIADIKSKVLPVGSIIPFYGDLANIPSDFALCDGNNGTPNLLDRFLVGAGSGYTLGASGGENTHVLTINEMPSHAHTRGTMNITGKISGGSKLGVFGSSAAASGAFNSIDLKKFRYNTISSVGLIETTVGFGNGFSFNAANSWTGETSYAGANYPHENRPPYVAVYYIMKINNALY